MPPVLCCNSWEKSNSNLITLFNGVNNASIKKHDQLNLDRQFKKVYTCYVFQNISRQKIKTCPMFVSLLELSKFLCQINMSKQESRSHRLIQEKCGFPKLDLKVQQKRLNDHLQLD